MNPPREIRAARCPARPRVSVTSAFYNTGPALLEMVRSVLAQTFDDWELVLLDDGSTDDSLQIAASLDDPRIRVFTNECNLGRSASLNRLTHLARGEYIARMDSDDLSAPQRLEQQVALLDARPDVDVVGSGLLYVDQHLEPLGHWLAPPEHEAICAEPLRMIRVAHGTILARRPWLERHRYDERLPLGVDFDLLLRSHETTRFANVPDVLYWYRFAPSFNLRKQLVTRRTVAGYVYRYCRARGQPLRALWNLAVQYGKFAATVALFLSGQSGRLLRRRFSPLTPEQHDHYRRQIQQVLATPLPQREVQPAQRSD